MRGTVDLLDGEDWYGRITPACAGNRSKKIHIIGGARDHPRVCGEQFMLLSLQKAVIGSPPRVRGTVQLDFAGLDGARITPACAGNRDLYIYSDVEEEDHPRVCGEQGSSMGVFSSYAGSPPRVRGTGAGAVEAAPAGRITPACAGNSVMLVERMSSE